ncbi:phosphatidate cytidylyltransferase [Mucilaginibacter ginsenosidivorans]|uniref:phosphatidate cytidylyltransferase n=1 Tax=Mucilaginibacter ginsenosidivorans TaxID=398053 RepID=UPI0035F025CE
MKTRAITGFFFIIVMLASMLLGGYVFDAFYLLLAILALIEFYRLIKGTGFSPAQVLGVCTGILVYLAGALVSSSANDVPHGYLLVLVPITAAVFIQELYRKSATPFANIGYTFLGVIFVVVPFSFFHALGYTRLLGDYCFHIPLGFFIMLWANDTGAYLSGYFFGRTKLFERHSPKKTWEGFIGGVLISAAAGYILSIFYRELTWYQWVTVAVLISSFGTLGDLVESMFKRSINVKDSGNILPGHGGLLDRFDGLLLAAPIVYTYLYFVTNL